MDWKEIDPNMAVRSIADPDSLRWYDPAEAPFAVRGLYWYAQEKKLQRFPEWAFPLLEEKAPGAAVLARDPTGGQIAFETDAARIVVAAGLRSAHTMDHFAATGEMGIDCYLAYPGEAYAFEDVTRFRVSESAYVCEIVRGRGNEWKRVLLNLPLYMAVESLHIGLPKEASVSAPQPLQYTQPVVFYGSSITQGGCASRPGMLYTNILSRRMGREFLNFGFSGSGKGEPEIASLLAEIRDPALYVLSYEPNAGRGIIQTLKPFIGILRTAHPGTPVLVVSRMQHQKTVHVPEQHRMWRELREFQRNTVLELQAAGDRNISFLDGRTLLKEAPDECFVDGEHPTDLGFWQIADALQPVLQKILKQK